MYERIEHHVTIIADSQSITGLLPRLIEYHLTVFSGLSLIVLALTTLTVVVMGIVALVQLRMPLKTTSGNNRITRSSQRSN
jgi:hypothetical protein